MAHTITVSKELFTALQQQATRRQKGVDNLAEEWLRQHLSLETYPGLEWRQGAGGWRVGISGTAIDVYTVVGYSQAGYRAEEIAVELLPGLSLDQVRSALRYYADYPDEVDQDISKNEPELMKARLYRALGPEAYYHLTGSTEQPAIIRESQAKYKLDEPDQTTAG
jgi:uncharacterized protein (DUF433 family)